MTTTDTLAPTDPAGVGATPPPGEMPGAVRQSLAFLALTYAAGIALALVLPGTVENPGPVSMLTAFLPALMVGLIRLAARRRHGPANPFPIGLRHLGLRSWPAAMAIPALAIGTSFAAAAALGVVRFEGLAGEIGQLPITIVFLSILFLGEEIGWRSYLFPRLATVMPERRAALLSGFLQALFHLPLLLLTPSYDGDGSRWIVVPGVVVVITMAGAVFGWLRIRSGSLWPVTIAHGTVNACLLEAPVLLADDPDLAAYLTSEGGLFTIVTVAIAAAVVLRRARWTPAPEAVPAA